MPNIRRIPLLLITLATGYQARVTAQDSDAGQAGEPAVAPVVLDGDTLFSVRGISSFPAERRAGRIAEAIREVAADRTVPVESLAAGGDSARHLLTAGGKRVLALVDADAELEGVSRGVLAEAYRQRIAEAVTEYRREREPSVLWRNGGRAALATLGLVIVLWLASRILRRLRSALDRRYRARISDVHIHSFEIVRAEQLWHALHRGISVTAGVVALVVVYVYLNYVLLLFPWTRGLGRNLPAIMLRPLVTLGDGRDGLPAGPGVPRGPRGHHPVAPKLVKLYLPARGDGHASRWPGFDAEWAHPTERIVRLVVIAFALVVAYPYIPGSGSEAFKGISLMLGVVFSLGSSSVISNLVAGQSLAFRRAFRVGDRVKIGEHVGEVTEIRLLTTFLRSPKNEQIVIPNSDDPQQRGGELQHPGQSVGAHPAHHRRHRVRDPLAPGRGDAAGGRGPHARIAA